MRLPATIRLRVLVAIIAVMVLTTAGTIFVAGRSHEQALERSVTNLLDARAAAVVSAAPGATDFATLSRRVGTIPGYQWGISTLDGRTLGSVPPAELDSVDYRYRIVQLSGGGELAGATAVIWTTTDAIRADQATLLRQLLVIGLVALALSIALTILVTDAALRSLDEMADRARRISAGERTIRMAGVGTSPEIARTAQAIDDMLDDLEQSGRRTQAAELEAVTAHEQVRSFLTDAAHELKTPLAGIQAASEALLHLPGDATPEERAELTILLAREANRGGHLVNSMLEAAHLESGAHLRVAELEVLPLLQAEKTRLSVSLPKLSVDVVCDESDGPLLVAADRNAFTSVIRNLIDNGATAAGVGGWLMLVCRPFGSDTPGPMVEVLVVDSGPGIAAADRERVFDRLVRLPSTVSSAKGSGLGLAIARGYARAMGGDVAYSDEPLDLTLPSGAGAVFSVRLPRVQVQD
ncbi:ATP-binding protein [Propionibacteriaceae bacterium G1746]|uniref:HAMP domain-containing sensor histidine kinase n=1 Tax=Aestuariimicrobium sp. G57 TaxID=3418485 RepID=UPI003C25E8B0